MKIPVLVLVAAISTCAPSTKEPAKSVPEASNFAQIEALARVGPDHYRQAMKEGKRVLFVNLSPDRTPYVPETLHYKDYRAPEFAEVLHARRPDVIYTYCSCPDDYSAAAIALSLREQGFANVHPIAGGVHTLEAHHPKP